MGVGGKFWDVLKPYATQEGPDFLRDKRVAVDLSFWIVQHHTLLKSSPPRLRTPHLRLTLFRTINLFSKFGAYPVFVVDGTPSPLKSQARILRFCRGIDTSRVGFTAEDGASVERNRVFLKYVRECVELLQLLGMPVVRAKGEAEALCAQLNREGCVDACITADSDAFLFGAKCVIKSIQPNCREPFECYHMSDIEAGLALKRNHLIAVALLVGNDHDLNGVHGIGVETALRFVQRFSENEILDGLRMIGNGNAALVLHGFKAVNDIMQISDDSSPKSKSCHCTFCGHPGTKKIHFQSSCEYCISDNNQGCLKKPEQFRCNCLSCDQNRKEKEQQRHVSWQMKVCDKISAEPKFPNEDIIQMYSCNNHGDFTDDGPRLSWKNPDTDMLVDFLVLHHLWDASYIRQRMIPMLTTIYLREMAVKAEKRLLHGQYEFDSVQRVKVRYGHQTYVIKWKKVVNTSGSVNQSNLIEEFDGKLEEIVAVDESNAQDDESDVLPVQVDGGYLLTDENMELTHAAFPEAVDRFLQAKQLKESKRRKNKAESPKSNGIQLNITEFFRSAKKAQCNAKQGDACGSVQKQDNEASNQKRKSSSSGLPKSVRRRLLFG